MDECTALSIVQAYFGNAAAANALLGAMNVSQIIAGVHKKSGSAGQYSSILQCLCFALLENAAESHMRPLEGIHRPFRVNTEAL